jgi:phosphocarrier protein HPr
MIIKEYHIQAAEGLHARPATILLRLAKKFQASIQIKKQEKQIQLNSLLNILGLTLKYGDNISLIIDGEDENDAAEAMDGFFREQLKGL